MAIDEVLAKRVELLVQSIRPFLRFLQHRIGSRADAEDVLRTAFLRLLPGKTPRATKTNWVRGSISCCGI
jgi:DNA-directed RNA polymerase specialized sigma24 family protein